MYAAKQMDSTPTYVEPYPGHSRDYERALYEGERLFGALKYGEHKETAMDDDYTPLTEEEAEAEYQRRTAEWNAEQDRLAGEAHRREMHRAFTEQMAEYRPGNPQWEEAHAWNAGPDTGWL